MTEARALVILDRLDDGRRAVVRVGDDRLTLADLDGEGAASPLFPPTTLERLIVFADQAAAGHPAALTHPKAHLFLAALALGLVASLETEKDIACRPTPCPHCSPV